MPRAVRSSVTLAHPTDPNVQIAAGEVIVVDDIEDAFIQAGLDTYLEEVPLSEAPDAAVPEQTDPTQGATIVAPEEPGETWLRDDLMAAARDRAIAVPHDATKQEILNAIRGAG